VKSNSRLPMQNNPPNNRTPEKTLKLPKPLLSQTQSQVEHQRDRSAYAITITVMIAIIPTVILFAYFGLSSEFAQLYIPATILAISFFFDFYLLNLIKNNKRDRAMFLLVSIFVINVLVVLLLVQGLGLIIALSIGLIIAAVVGLAVSSNYLTSGIAAAISLGILTLGLDAALKLNRIEVPELARYTPYITAGMAVPISIIFIRGFNSFRLQTKITLGILLTGGFTVFTLVIYGVNRANFIGATLADRYEASIRSQTESKIENSVATKAKAIDKLLLDVQDDLKDAVKFRAGLERNKLQEADGIYWDASLEMVRLPGGQYDNSGSDLASVYIPNTYTLTDQMRADLNTTIYLDLLAPNILSLHPTEVASIYYISKYGYTVYYPNIDLARNIEPSFDPTQQIFYTIATPENNPNQAPRWTPPYEDPAGAGLIITLSIPVYDGNSFEGVMSADVRLKTIINEVASTQISESGIPLLVDNGGLVIAMTDAGYRYFGLTPEVLNINESPTQTILSSSSKDIQSLALQVVSTDTSIIKSNINGIETYLAVDSLEAANFKFAYIAPANELEGEIFASRAQVENDIRETLRSASVILLSLFIAAFIASLFIGQVITRPLTRLTETVEQIAAGNLSSRASVETLDESGALARSFNAMADRLAQTLQGLETRITERTQELEKLSENNAYRASLFESIARISRIINTSQNLERLLPQITETISDQLGFYHVGIFIVDAQREYAVLMAANSDGGKVMLTRNHRLRVGEIGIVGNVTQSGSPRVALDVGQDATYFNNPDLPETHSEIALPLKSGSEIIGALDVQSKMTNAFSEEDVNILSVLADQVSIAIQNARSFEQSKEALDRAERAAAQLSGTQWSQFLKQKPISAFHYDGVNATRMKPEQKVQANNLTFPILLRGVQIGTIKLSAPDLDRKWDDNEIAITQATAERAALAIETARLLQDAQKRASKERTIGDISAKIGSLINIENIVQTAIQELGDTLPGTDVAIQFTSGQSGQS